MVVEIVYVGVIHLETSLTLATHVGDQLFLSILN